MKQNKKEKNLRKKEEQNKTLVKEKKG